MRHGWLGMTWGIGLGALAMAGCGADESTPRDSGTRADVHDAATTRDVATGTDTGPGHDVVSPTDVFPGNDVQPASDVPAATDVPATTDVPSGTDVQTVLDVVAVDAADGVGATDVTAPTDVPVHGTTPIFGNCAQDTDCAGATSLCSTVFPGGLCTLPCTNDSPCTGGGLCYLTSGSTTGLCLPDCSATGACSTSQLCFGLDATSTRAGCFPSCYTTPPSGVAACTSGLTCDAYSGACDTMAPTGADNGAACTMDSACRSGLCILGTDTSGPTGFLGGYCISYGRLPDLATGYAAGQPLPRSNCPTGSVVLPTTDTAAAGDPGACFASCTSSTGCRSGYTCVIPMIGTGHTSNGYCAPLDCAQTGMACPSGTTCHTMPDGAGGTYGNCG